VAGEPISLVPVTRRGQDHFTRSIQLADKV
jgi:hypothetical protein